MRIEQRIEEKLKDGRGDARTLCLLRRRRREAAAGAVAADPDACRIKAIVRRMSHRPEKGRKRILHRSRKAMLWRQPIVNREDAKTAIGRKPRTEPVMGRDGAADIAAAVIIDEQRQTGCLVRAIETGWYLARRCFEDKIFHRVKARALSGKKIHGLREPLTRLRHVFKRHRRGAFAIEIGKKARLRIERLPVDNDRLQAVAKIEKGRRKKFERRDDQPFNHSRRLRRSGAWPQAETRAICFSSRSCCSSPVSNISRMISQPPINS